MMLLRHFVVAALLLAAGSASAADKVRLANLKFAHYGAISYMKELAPKYDLEIEERFFAKGIDIQPAMVAGEIDIAASAVDGAIAGRARGVPIFAVAGFAKGGIRIVAGAKTGVTDLASTKGRKVGVTRGGAQELALLAEFDKAGLTWSDKPGKDVQIVYMAYPDLNQALQAGDIDVICQSEPYASQAINKKYGVEVLKPYDTALGMPSRSLVFTEAFYNNHDVAERTMRLFVEATKLFIDQPEIAERYVVDKMFKGQISSQDFRDAIGNSPYAYDITPEHVQTTTDMMVRFGVGKLEKPPVATDWVRTDLLADALKTVN